MPGAEKARRDPCGPSAGWDKRGSRSEGQIAYGSTKTAGANWPGGKPRLPSIDRVCKEDNASQIGTIHCPVAKRAGPVPVPKVSPAAGLLPTTLRVVCASRFGCELPADLRGLST